MNFGLFGLGDVLLGETGPLCDKYNPDCRTWPVHCLNTDLNFLPGALALRAQAVAGAWGGVVPDGKGFCSGSRRLSNVHSARLIAHVRLGNDLTIEDAAARLSNDSFSSDLVARTIAVVGSGSPAIDGPMSLHASSVADQDHPSTGSGAQGTPEAQAADGQSDWTSIATWPWWSWILLGGVAGLLLIGIVATVVLRTIAKRKARALSSNRQESMSDEQKEPSSQV